MKKPSGDFPDPATARNANLVELKDLNRVAGLYSYSVSLRDGSGNVPELDPTVGNDGGGLNRASAGPCCYPGAARPAGAPVTPTFPGFPAPAAGTEAPLEMLAACHGRIDQHAALMRRLVAHVATHGADRQARTAAARVVRYFDLAAPDHHADEERDLFPALLESMAGSDAVCLRELTESLTADHRRLQAGWEALRPALLRLAAGEMAMPDASAVDHWVDACRQHITREDAELLPMAARLLADVALAQIGQAMRERRGIAAV